MIVGGGLAGAKTAEALRVTVTALKAVGRSSRGVNVWDVQDDIQDLITTKDAVDRKRLADDGVPVSQVRTS